MSLARGLLDGEVAICQQVFGATLPTVFLRSKVMLKNGLGAGGRPFTSIDVGIARYHIFIGPRAFDQSAVGTLEYQATLVHEMTHVWQMHNSSWFGAVWFDSLKTQGCRQGNAYVYGEGNLNKPWDDFGVEEQAQIVEDWYKNGRRSTDPRFHYIRDNIRGGKAGFVTDIPGGSA